MKRYWRKLVVVFAVLACLYAAYRYTLHRMVEAKLATIRAQGYPATLAELGKWYPEVPAEENAATVMNQGFASFHLSEESRSQKFGGNVFRTLPQRAEPLSIPMRTLIDEYLITNQVPLDLYHAGAAMKRCHYGYQHGGYEDMSWAGIPALGLRLLRLEAIARADTGDKGQSLHAITDMFALGRSLTEVPSRFYYLHGLVGVRTSLATLQYALNRLPFDDRQLTELANTLRQTSDSLSLTRPLVGERCSLIEFFGPEGDSWIGKAAGLRALILLYSLGSLDRFVEVSQMPESKQHEYALGIERLPENRLPLFRGPKNQATLLEELNLRAYNHDAITALGVERFRLANQRVPERLDELVPAYLNSVPADPFDGRPLRYKKLAKGYVVYSVGENGVDDGGDENKDITFTVER